MLNNLGHYNQAVPDLHEVLALETHNQSLRNFVMPLVAHVSGRKCMYYIVVIIQKVPKTHLKFSKSTVSFFSLPCADLSVTRNLVIKPG